MNFGRSEFYSQNRNVYGQDIFHRVYDSITSNAFLLVFPPRIVPVYSFASSFPSSFSPWIRLLSRRHLSRTSLLPSSLSKAQISTRPCYCCTTSFSASLPIIFLWFSWLNRRLSSSSLRYSLKRKKARQNFTPKKESEQDVK